MVQEKDPSAAEVSGDFGSRCLLPRRVCLCLGNEVFTRLHPDGLDNEMPLCASSSSSMLLRGEGGVTATVESW